MCIATPTTTPPDETLMLPCPFCNADLTKFHAYTMSCGVDLTILTISICVECGEPLAITRKGWRKPTDDEYLAIGGDPKLRVVREVFLELKKHETPPISAMFDAFWKDKLDGKLTAQHVDTPEKMKAVIEDIFMSGVTLMLLLVKEASEVETPEEFEAKMMTLELETKAYGELIQERKRAVGQND